MRATGSHTPSTRLDVYQGEKGKIYGITENAAALRLVTPVCVTVKVPVAWLSPLSKCVVLPPPEQKYL